MAKVKLDRSRPFGEVIGIVSDGVRYQQDGKDFDGQGNEVGTKTDTPASPGVSTAGPSSETVVVTAPQPVKKKGRPKGAKNKKKKGTRKRRTPETTSPEVFQ